jgi:hypothetical protein
MWAKAVEQSHGLTTVLALRWYSPGNALRPELDLIAMEANDFAELLADARAYREAQAKTASSLDDWAARQREIEDIGGSRW